MLDLPKELERSATRCAQASLDLNRHLATLGQKSLELMDGSDAMHASEDLGLSSAAIDGSAPEELWHALPAVFTGVLATCATLAAPEKTFPTADLAVEMRGPIIRAAQEARAAITEVRDKILPKLEAQPEAQERSPLKRQLDSMHDCLMHERSRTLRSQNQALTATLKAWSRHDGTSGPHRTHKSSAAIATILTGFHLATATLPSLARSLRRTMELLRPVYSKVQFQFTAIEKAMWVLECEETNTQGTAFALEGYGLVTCDHVLGSATRAFRAHSFLTKRTVTVRAREQVLDLAILDVEGGVDHLLPVGTADQLKPMDPLAVFGYPNFRLGDTGTLVPGQVVGFRVISGVRRILTDAPIICGVSGGPAIDIDGRVIGVAVTGAERMEYANETEHHGIIPIDALRYLNRGA